jgi:hypothetical protein
MVGGLKGGVTMTPNKFFGAFCQLDRDDAVLIPLALDAPLPADFYRVEVQLDDGITQEDLAIDAAAAHPHDPNREAINLLMGTNWNEAYSGDPLKIRFVLAKSNDWDENYEKWRTEGWDGIGVGFVQYHSKYEDWDGRPIPLAEVGLTPEENAHLISKHIAWGTASGEYFVYGELLTRAKAWKAGGPKLVELQSMG